MFLFFYYDVHEFLFSFHVLPPLSVWKKQHRLHVELYILSNHYFLCFSTQHQSYYWYCFSLLDRELLCHPICFIARPLTLYCSTNIVLHWSYNIVLSLCFTDYARRAPQFSVWTCYSSSTLFVFPDSFELSASNTSRTDWYHYHLFHMDLAPYIFLLVRSDSFDLNICESTTWSRESVAFYSLTQMGPN